jgi:hypothetical protein
MEENNGVPVQLSVVFDKYVENYTAWLENIKSVDVSKATRNVFVVRPTSPVK